MRILGIDPGTLNVGYGIIEPRGNRLLAVSYGVIKASPRQHLHRRLVTIYEGITRLIAESSPTAVAIEEAFYGINAKSALKIGEGRAVAILSAALAGLPVHEYAPTVVKKSVTGNGRAHKTQVQAMVKVLLGLKSIPKPEDAADALAIAICHCHRLR